MYSHPPAAAVSFCFLLFTDNQQRKCPYNTKTCRLYDVIIVRKQETKKNVKRELMTQTFAKEESKENSNHSNNFFFKTFRD